MLWKEKAIEHALKATPKESCGLLINIKGKLVYKECKNLTFCKSGMSPKSKTACVLATRASDGAPLT